MAHSKWWGGVWGTDFGALQGHGGGECDSDVSHLHLKHISLLLEASGVSVCGGGGRGVQIAPGDTKVKKKKKAKFTKLLFASSINDSSKLNSILSTN